jgi:hypothetical protein
MAKIERYQGNLEAFASDAETGERTIFDSVTPGDSLTDNINASYKRGWGVVGVNENPTKQDFNAMAYVNSQLAAYLHQVGVAEWNGAQEYHQGSFANRNGILYVCKTNDHVSATAPESDGTNWGESGQDKADLIDGLVPANQLPSYVDDVLEYANLAGFPATGATAKIYIALDTGDIYRWSGSAYIKISDVLSAADVKTLYESNANTNAFTDALLSKLNGVEASATGDQDLSDKADLIDGLVPANQLPSYVDDVLEYANLAGFPATGATAKIYIALDTGDIYRWSGSAYIKISDVLSAADVKTLYESNANTNAFTDALLSKLNGVEASATGDQDLSGLSPIAGPGSTQAFATGALTVTGAISATGDVTAFSDKRLKTNIEAIPNALDKIQKVSGYTFDRTDISETQTGVIAQELLEVLPEAVAGGPTEENPDAYYSVAYGNVVGLLIEGIKEQQKRIDTLEEKLNSKIGG